MARVALLRICSLLLCSSLLALVFSIEPPQPKRKRTPPSDEQSNSRRGPDTLQQDARDRFSNDEASSNKAKPNVNGFAQQALLECPPCAASKRNSLQYATEAFWRNDFLTAYGCACHHLLSKPEDGFAQSIVYSLSQAKLAYLNFGAKAVLPLYPAPPMRKWEILGPINVGKLEHDADSTFQNGDAPATNDVALHILSMYPNATVYSDIANGGKVKWTTTTANEQGEVTYNYCRLPCPEARCQVYH